MSDTPSSIPSTARPARSVFVVLVILVLWAVVASAWGWWELHGLKQALAERSDAAAHAAEQARQGVDTLAARVDGLDQGQRVLGDKQSLLEESFRTLEERVQREATGWVAAEAQYLLRIANDRLHLASDPDTALAALEAADVRLQDLKDPTLFETRRLLSEELAALRALPGVDVMGAALTLSTLAERVERLPVPGEETRAGMSNEGDIPEIHDWRSALGAIWDSLRSLVIIKRQGEAGHPVLAPEERYFLRQNLALKLETARLALLQHDSALFRASVHTARGWLQDYFDTGAAETMNAVNTLARLERADVAPPLPDISGSLQALDQWLAKRQGRRPGARP